MAHFQKVTLAGARGLIKHCARTEEKERDNVDFSLREKNVFWVKNPVSNDPKDAMIEFEGSAPYIERIYDRRMKDVQHMKRDDVKGLLSLVVTAPKGFSENNSVDFLEACTKYARERFGTENVIAGCAHFDEPGARPHVHILMTPVVKAEKKGKSYEKLCCKDFLKRADYDHLHENLEKYVKEHCPRLPDFSLTNGITKESGGNRSVSQLKYDSALAKLREDEAVLAKQKEKYSALERQLHDQQEKVRERAESLDQKISALRRQEAAIHEATQKQANREACLAKREQELSAKEKEIKQRDGDSIRRSAESFDVKDKARKKLAAAEARETALAKREQELSAREKAVEAAESALIGMSPADIRNAVDRAANAAEKHVNELIADMKPYGKDRILVSRELLQKIADARKQQGLDPNCFGLAGPYGKDKVILSVHSDFIALRKLTNEEILNRYANGREGWRSSLDIVAIMKKNEVEKAIKAVAPDIQRLEKKARDNNLLLRHIYKTNGARALEGIVEKLEGIYQDLPGTGAKRAEFHVKRDRGMSR